MTEHKGPHEKHQEGVSVCRAAKSAQAPQPGSTHYENGHGSAPQQHCSIAP